MSKSTFSRKILPVLILLVIAIAAIAVLIVTLTPSEGEPSVSTEAPVTEHDYRSTVVEPTCTEDGKTVYTCIHCGDSYEEPISAKGHAYEEAVTEATCTADGAKVSTCSTCGDVVTEVLPARGHSYTEAVTEATCTVDGAKVSTCSTCGDVVTEVLPAHGHSYTETVTEATCTADGTKVSTCSICGDVKTETLSALGHDTKTKTTKATCTSKGKKVTTCSRCDYSKTETLKALGHDYKEQTTPATCTEDGMKVTTCSRCGDSKTETLVAIGHDFVVTTTDPTCTERGKTVTTCSRCDYKRTAYPAALGHDYDEDYVCRREECGYVNVVYAADYGAVGDGVTDDGPAISRAVNAAKSKKAMLLFEKNKTYYIGTSTNKDANFTTPFLIVNSNGMAVDGNGSTFKFAPHLTYFCLWGSRDITIRNCNFDYSHSVYLVGTVQSISGNTITFSTDIEPYADYYDYTGMTAFSVKKAQSGVQGYSHGFIKTVTKTASKQVKITYTSGYSSYRVGDIIYLPNPGIAHTGSESIFIGGNKGTITLQNIEVRAARNFVFHINGNEEDIYLNDVDLVPGSANNRAAKMVAWRDGFHCKNNRGAIHWENCENDVLFDDVMNIRNTLGKIQTATGKYQFTVTNVETTEPCYLKAGDIIDFYDQINDVYYGYARVKTATISGNAMSVVLDSTYCTVDVTKVNKNTGRVACRNNCAPGSTIKNCTFRGSFRFNRDLTAENSTFYCLSVWILVEGGVEGPLPGNITFRRCTFRYGTMQIDGYNRWDVSGGKYLPNIGAQIQGIRAYDCTYQNGFKVTSSTGCYLEKYVNGVLQADVSTLRPTGYVTRNDFKTLTAAELQAGYTYDFSSGNALRFTGTPANGYPVTQRYTTLSRVNASAAAAMRAAGFGENVFYYNDSAFLRPLTGMMQAGKRYQVTMKVYDCTGNLTTLNPADSMVLLKMTDGVQKEDQVNYTCKADPSDPRLVTLTFTFTVNLASTNDFLLFYRIGNPTEFYIGSLTVRQL